MEFDEFLQSLEFDNGKISQGGQRLIALPQLFIAGLQRALEEVYGEEAAFAVAMNTMGRGAKASAKGFNQILGDISPEQKVRAFWAITVPRGWGDAEITEITMEPFRMEMQVKNSYLKDTVPEPKKMNSYYYYSAVSILEELLKAAGVDVELEVEQTMWESKGDEYDEYIFKQK